MLLPLTPIEPLLPHQNVAAVLSSALTETVDLYDDNITGLNTFTCVTAWYIDSPSFMQFVALLHVEFTSEWWLAFVRAGFSPAGYYALSLAHQLPLPKSTTS